MVAISHLDRLYGGMFGLLVGDALGVPYEFHDPEHLPSYDQIEMIPPEGFNRAHPGTPPGTWSDDGAQALALIAALNEDPEFNDEILARNIMDWLGTGRYTPDSRVFDVGLQTQRACHNLAAGSAARVAGPDTVFDNGNGALMRCWPVITVQRQLHAAYVAVAQGAVTHGHIRSKLCCLLYALLAWNLLQGMSPKDALTQARTEFHSMCDGKGNNSEFNLIMQAENEPHLGTGYVVDSLWSAIHCLMSTSSYEECVKRAILLGNDTDTTACIAGSLAGTTYGVNAIPERWMSALKHKAFVYKLCEERFDA